MGIQPPENIAIITQPLLLNEAKGHNISVNLARLDLIHPHYGGNKWFKLKYNLAEAKEKGYNKILTYGGAFSNHLYATAAICAGEGLESIGVIRGEERLPLNDTLQFCTDKGMQLVYLSRHDYDNRHDIINNKLKHESGNFLEIPDGGCNVNGIKGCMEITSSIPDFDYIICACGTFTTLAGIALSLKENQKAIGISVLKADGIGEQSLDALNELAEKELHISLQDKLKQVEVLENYHFGGYAKTTTELESFMASFYTNYNVKLDHVYTGKMMYAVTHLLKSNYFPAGSRLIVVMSGRPS